MPDKVESGKQQIGCEFCLNGDRPDLSPYLGQFIHRMAARDRTCTVPPVKDVTSLLCNLAQILNTAKQEWGESWSSWDQEQYDTLVKLQRWLLAHEPKPVTTPSTFQEER